MATNRGIAEVGVDSPAGGYADDVERPMRADARRNRDRLVSAAREVFGAQGVGSSMEAVARQAGVGVGTLYRHFPTRLDLVEAVYQSDVEELADTAQRTVGELEPWPAVVAFFDAFIRYAQTKQTLLAELQQAFEKNPEGRSRARGLIDAAFDVVIERGKNAGVVRDDVFGSDLTQLVSPMCSNPSISPEQTRRLMGMILDGLRAPSAPRPSS